MMARNPATLFVLLAIAAVLWLGVAVMSPMHGRGMPGWRHQSQTSLLAGPGRAGHMWSDDVYILSRRGGPPEQQDVERVLNDWLLSLGNKRLQISKVTEKDARTFQADVTTRDGSLVQRFEIDRRTGFLRSVED